MSDIKEPCPVCGVVEWSLGVKHEQERIIQVLEEAEASMRNDVSNPANSRFDQVWFEVRADAIADALSEIKGENK